MTSVGRKPGRPRADTTDVPTDDKILAAAARLFMELGYDGVSTDQVATETGVTKAMIYYYFSSKPQLYTAAVLRLMDSIRERTAQILKEDLPLRERLQKIATARFSIPAPRYNFDTMMRNPEHVLTPEQLDEMRRAEHRLMDTLTEAFKKAVEDGELRDVNAVMASYLFAHSLAAAEHMLAALTDGRERNPSQMAKEMISMLYDGLGRDKG